MRKWFASLKRKFIKSSSAAGAQTLTAALLNARAPNLQVSQSSFQPIGSSNPASTPQSGQPQGAVLQPVHKTSNAEDKNHRRREQRYWLFSVIFSGATMAAAIGAGVAAAGAWRASQQSADEARIANGINQKALAASVSASVYFGNAFYFHDVVDLDGITKEGVLYHIGNSGTSRTQFLKYQAICVNSVSAIPSPYNEALLRKEIVRHVSLAPKREVDPLACSFDVSTMIEIIRQKQWLYVFGWASYADTTDPSFVHRVEFCLQADGSPIPSFLVAPV